MKKRLEYILIILSAIICIASYVGTKKIEENVNNSDGKLTKLHYDGGEKDANLDITVEEKESWKKAFPDDFVIDEHFKDSKFAGRNDVGQIEGVGRTVEVTLKNTSEYRINKWYIEYEVPCDMYLDKAWNGTVEISQFGGKNTDEIVANEEEFANTSLYSIPVTELYLIPLAKGDKVIYHPSEYEYPIVEEYSQDNIDNEITIGMIFYTEDDSFKFSGFTVNYYVVRGLDEYPLYSLLQALTIIGIVIMIACIVAIVVSTRYDKMHKHDMEIISQAIGTFAKFIDSKDKYTHNHSYRVAEYSKLIATKLKMSDREIEDIYYIGLLHDTGKIAIDDKILNKPGKLTDEEYEIIKSHTTIGADMLKDFTAIKNIQYGALYHHERYDGMGYPTGVIGEEIPLVGRIICVADSYDAMSSNRCYRDQLDKEVIIEQLVTNKGRQFDPAIVDIFLECIESGEVDEVRRKLQDAYGKS